MINRLMDIKNTRYWRKNWQLRTQFNIEYESAAQFLGRSVQLQAAIKVILSVKYIRQKDKGPKIGHYTLS